MQAYQQLLYYETVTDADGTFALTHLAPGKYLIVSRPLPDDQTLGRSHKTVASDATERAKLRRKAEASKQGIELKLCQRMKDYTLKLP
jgi:hypothetical protein